MKFINSNYPFTKNLHLIISTICIVPVALVYGLYPTKVLFKLFDLKVVDTNLLTIFRAMMSLYLAMTAVWITGILRPGFWFTATITNIVFMGGLAFGRLLSLVLDGLPSKYFLAGLMVESALTLLALKSLKQNRAATVADKGGF